MADRKRDQKNNRRRGGLSGALMLLMGIIGVILILSMAGMFDFSPSKEITYQEFIEMVKNDEVEAVQIQTETLYGIERGSQYSEDDFFEEGRYDFRCVIPSEEVFASDMAALISAREDMDAALVTAADYPFAYKKLPAPTTSVLEYILINVIPIIILFALVYFLVIRPQVNGNRQMQTFTKSRARATMGSANDVTFKDVAGADEEKNELQEIVDFLKHPRKFTDMGARIPKGVLLVGPPGTGKTLLAKATAGEANVPFFSISGSDFVELYVGVGASRVRDMFLTAKKCAPSIIFIDEIDAVGRQRGTGLGGGHDEREQTLNQLLVEMDGFAVNEGIIVIAATNRPDILDPALLRPGRFDRQVTVNYPDVRGREAILNVHARKKPLAPDVDLSVIARMTVGFTGADLANVLNEAAILAARYGKPSITSEEISEAITRVEMGPAKVSLAVSEEDKRVTAYHEAGHAIVAKYLPHCDPVHEITIIPRGMAGGYTMTLPEKDKTYVTRGKLLDLIAELLAGRAAESLTLPDITTGAYSDLKRASEIARKMVGDYGMSDKIGPLFLGGQSEIIVGKELGHSRNYSEETASKVDDEVYAILETQYLRAVELLKEKRVELDRVAEALMEYESLTGEEFNAICEGREVSVVPYRKKAAEREALRAEARKKGAARRPTNEDDAYKYGAPDGDDADERSDAQPAPDDESAQDAAESGKAPDGE
ncbi:MAG: ATP-dependent zinc metalloprotease FtsH [Clostridia bacterium]|nr:ATP-dependent zinc metalloprotease FtsH [Clostridia bacterium]